MAAYRRIPPEIAKKLDLIKSDNIIVAAVKQIRAEDIPKFSHLGIKLTDGKLIFNPEILPPVERGQASRGNQEDHEVVRRDLPKVDKEIYLGLRPSWGDWSKGSFPLFQVRKVYCRDFLPATRHTIGIEKLDEFTKNDSRIFVIKFRINYAYDRKSPNFNDDLLFALSLLEENIGAVDIYPEEATKEDFLKHVYVNWEIFPPGKWDPFLKKALSTYRKPTDGKIKQIERTKQYLDTMKPQNYIFGMSGNNRYFGAQYSDRLVVFENLDYGNAAYILYDDWKILSILSRSELLRRTDLTFDRVVHTGDWQNTVKHIVNHNRKGRFYDKTKKQRILF